MSRGGKTDKEKWLKWVPYIIIGCTFLGGLLGSILSYVFQGVFPYEVLIAIFIVSILMSIFTFMKQKRKKSKMPEADERVVRNISRFFAYSSHITLFLVVILLGVVTLVGAEEISIFYLWILFFSYIWVVGLGVMIVKRR